MAGWLGPKSDDVSRTHAGARHNSACQSHKTPNHVACHFVLQRHYISWPGEGPGGGEGAERKGEFPPAVYTYSWVHVVILTRGNWIRLCSGFVLQILEAIVQYTNSQPPSSPFLTFYFYLLLTFHFSCTNEFSKTWKSAGSIRDSVVLFNHCDWS
jgi:hypothetical protein